MQLCSSTDVTSRISVVNTQEINKIDVSVIAGVLFRQAFLGVYGNALHC